MKMIRSNSIRDYFEIFPPGQLCSRIAPLSPVLCFSIKQVRLAKQLKTFKRRSIIFLYRVKYVKQLKLKKVLRRYHEGVVDVIAHNAMTSSFSPSQPCHLIPEGPPSPQ